jgi:hypothetical protein
MVGDVREMTDLEQIKSSLDRLTVSQQNLTIAQARTEERVIAANSAVEHFNNNIKFRMDSFASYKELETLRNDVEELKDDKKWIVRSILGSWLAWLGMLWALITKKFS